MSLEDPSCIVWESAAESHAGKVRTENQDAVLARPEVGVWAIADGMGGHASGAAASRTVVENLGSLGRPTSLDEHLASTLSVLEHANDQLINEAKVSGRGLSGSTVAALLNQEDQGVVVWVGDSRVYLLREGRLEQLTRDHSQIEELIELGLVEREKSKRHPSSNVLTRAIGAAPVLTPDVEFLTIRPGDTFLICSDGLYNEIDEQEIVRALSNSSCTHSASSLLERALQARARDNVSLIVARAMSNDEDRTLINPLVTANPTID